MYKFRRVGGGLAHKDRRRGGGLFPVVLTIGNGKRIKDEKNSQEDVVIKDEQRWGGWY